MVLASVEGDRLKTRKHFHKTKQRSILTVTMMQHVALCLIVSVSSGVICLGERLSGAEREAVTRYLLGRMLGLSSTPVMDKLPGVTGDHQGAGSIIYPQVREARKFCLIYLNSSYPINT